MIQPNTVYVFRLKLNNLPDYERTYTLTAYEKNKLHQLSGQKRKQYQHTRYLIRDILRQHEIEPDSLYYLESGKPCLNPPYSISLSHSQNIWLIALMSTKKLGIDIQITTFHNADLFKKRYQLSLPENELTAYWAKAEAYAKATEISIFQSLRKNIDLELSQQSLFFWHIPTPHPIAIMAADQINHVIFS